MIDIWARDYCVVVLWEFTAMSLRLCGMDKGDGGILVG